MNQFVAPKQAPTIIDVDTSGVEVIDLSVVNKQLLPTDGKKVGPNIRNATELLKSVYCLYSLVFYISYIYL